MFYEEKLVNGMRYCRTEPTGEWMLGRLLLPLRTPPAESADRGEAVCPTCDGSGRMGGDGSPDPCDDCNATGRLAAPSPAESAEGNGWTNGVRDNIGPQPLKWNITQSDPGAALSGVSDADALANRFLSDTSQMPDEWQDWRAEFARDLRNMSQPQPGRVEGVRAEVIDMLFRLETMQPPNVILQQIKMLGEMANLLRRMFKEQDHG